MKNFGFVLCLIIILAACKLSPNNKSCILSSEVNMIKKHIKIDDETISRRDPMAVIDPLWWSVNIYESKKVYEEGLKSYSIYQRYVFAIMWYMGEVMNGGHYQFYSNSTGIVWEDVIKGFDLIGLEVAKAITEESIQRFGMKPSYDRTERERLLDSLDEDFEDLDKRFYELDRKINITDKIAAYILLNPRHFYFEGEIEVPE